MPVKIEGFFENNLRPTAGGWAQWMYSHWADTKSPAQPEPGSRVSPHAGSRAAES